MKAILLILVLPLSATLLFSQQASTWSRVYTFDESVIEMNTQKVTFGGQDIARVRFRWTFDSPQADSEKPQLKFKTRLEVIEFKCSQGAFRPYEVTLLDAAGKTISYREFNPPGEWRSVHYGSSMMERLYNPACELANQIAHPPVVDNERSELEKVAQFALSFSTRLEQAKDFKPLIEEFFTADYLQGYLNDHQTNWFLNLNRETAAKASHDELQRFYIALLNSGYYSFVYLSSQYPDASQRAMSDEQIIPPDVLEFIDNHPYTARYKGARENYEFLADSVDSLERLRGYTDLLEGVGALMRKRVAITGAEQSAEYRKMFDEWDLYDPTAHSCISDCFGLPKGTKTFTVNVPLFRLQVAEIKGKLKVISAIDYSH